VKDVLAGTKPADRIEERIAVPADIERLRREDV